VIIGSRSALFSCQTHNAAHRGHCGPLAALWTSATDAMHPPGTSVFLVPLGSIGLQQVVGGCCLGLLVGLAVSRMDVVGTFAQVPVPWAVSLSLSSTACILGCLFLAAHLGQAVTDQKSLDKWLQTALRNSKNVPGSGKGKEGDLTITPHKVESYLVLAAAYLCSTLFPALLSLRHPHHPRSPKHSPLTFYRPYTATATKPSLSFWVTGALGLLALDFLKSVVANGKKRESWPVWKQAVFYLVFYAISVTWLFAGSGFVHARQGWGGEHT
jgi:hypothetical protein